MKIKLNKMKKTKIDRSYWIYCSLCGKLISRYEVDTKNNCSIPTTNNKGQKSRRYVCDECAFLVCHQLLYRIEKMEDI